jgi:hypothetical protein
MNETCAAILAAPIRLTDGILYDHGTRYVF